MKCSRNVDENHQRNTSACTSTSASTTTSRKEKTEDDVLATWLVSSLKGRDLSIGDLRSEANFMRACRVAYQVPKAQGLSAHDDETTQRVESNHLIVGGGGRGGREECRVVPVPRPRIRLPRAKCNRISPSIIDIHD